MIPSSPFLLKLFLLFNCFVSNFFCLGRFSPFIFTSEGVFVFDDLGEYTSEDLDDWDKPRSFFGLGGI
jgi:hypothetical protein